MIPDEAIESAAKALKPSAWDDRVNWGAEGSREIHQNYYRSMALTALSAAAPHMGTMEWSVFRASDGDDATPVESFRWASRESAQHFIDNGYTQPEFWEPRGRVVGEWR